MIKNLILAAFLAVASLGFVGCASSHHQHGATCDGGCCKDPAACKKCCGDKCATCCKK